MNFKYFGANKFRILGIMILSFVVALVGYGAQNSMSDVKADGATPPSTVNVKVHKLQYAGTAPSIDNDGSEKSKLPDNVEAYDKSKYGSVEFTIYDITDDVSSKYSSTGLTDNDISEIVENATTYETDANKKDTQAVDDHGVAEFTNLPAYESSKSHHVYLIAETKHSKLIKTVASPMVIVTPMTNSNGEDYLNTINVYPKNEIQTLSFTLTKKAQKIGEDAKTLEGAKFLLYKGEPGKGEKVQELTTNSEGQITATGLTVGKYYFVEEPSANVSEDGAAGDGFLLGKDALNDANNKLTFEVTDEGTVTPDNLDYINYQKPDPTKTITNGKTTDNSFDFGATVDYKATLEVPGDIDKYTEYIWVDTPGTGLKYSDQTKFTLTYGDSADSDSQTSLTEGTDYTLTYDTTNKTYKINFLDSNSKVLNAKIAGKVISITYSMDIDPETAKVNTDIDNSYTFTWNNGTGEHTSTGKVAAHTYGTKFVKKSAGILGTGAAGETLQGAEFVVLNKDGKYMKKDATGNVSWVDAQSDATILTSDDKGAFEATGLAKGSYKLKEIKAPTGYQLMAEPLSFDVDAASYDNTIEVKNDKQGILSTGSQWLLLVMSLAIIAGAALAYRGFKKANA